MKMSVISTNKPKLSIVVVTYNTKDLLSPLLNSIRMTLDSWKKKTEIIIVDNASSDDTVEFVKKVYPDIKLIVNKINQGYAKANNQGIKIAQGEYILLLNSDTILTSDVINKMILYLDKHADVGVETCKLVLIDGKIDPACHRGFPTPWASLSYFLGFEKLFPKIRLFSGYHLWYKPLNSIHEIDCPSGAFYLARRDLVQKIGFFDEKFFMYGEDLDLSFRIKKAGWKIIYNPSSYAIHLKKQSGILSWDNLIKKQTCKAFYEAMKIFFDKHYQREYSSLIRRIIFIIIDIKKIFDLTKINLKWNYQSLSSTTIP